MDVSACTVAASLPITTTLRPAIFAMTSEPVVNEFVSTSDLFGNYRLIKEGKPLNERSTLIAYFSKEMERAPKLIGIRLGHYSLDQLYGLKSVYQDRLNRNDRVTAAKFWWAITRTVKAT